MSDLCSAMVIVFIFAIPVLSVIFTVKWIQKKPKKKIGVSILLCIVGTIMCSLIGTYSWLNDMTPEERVAYELEQQLKAELREREKGMQYLEKENETTMMCDTTEGNAQTEVYPTDLSENEINETIEQLEIVTFDDIYNEYQKNKLRADNKYKGNKYRITCTVYDIGDGGLNGLLGDLSVSAYTYSGNTKCILWCTFDEKTQREALSKINMGDEITFEGYCSSWGKWYDCELIE